MDNRYGVGGTNKFTVYGAIAIALAIALFLVIMFASNRLDDNKPGLPAGSATTTEPEIKIDAPADLPVGGEETPAQKAHGR